MKTVIYEGNINKNILVSSLQNSWSSKEPKTKRFRIFFIQNEENVQSLIFERLSIDQLSITAIYTLILQEITHLLAFCEYSLVL